MNNFTNDSPDPKDSDSSNDSVKNYSYERPDPTTSRPPEREVAPKSSNPDKDSKSKDD